MSSPLRRSTSGHSILHNVHISLKYINLRFSNLETSYGILHWDTPEVILYPVIFISISGDETQKLLSILLVSSIFRQGFKMIRINGTKSGRMGHILDETRWDQMDYGKVVFMIMDSLCFRFEETQWSITPSPMSS